MSDQKEENELTPIWHSLEELVTLHKEGKLPREIPSEQYIRQTQEASSRYINVHSYDGQLGGHIGSHKLKSYSVEEKQDRFSKLLQLINNHCSRQMIEQIQRGEGVMDSADNIDASDLLAEILSHKMTIDILLLMEEQLSDNFLLGQCPSGKVVRLIQIYDMVKDH
jgi:hypothetical protein